MRFVCVFAATVCAAAQQAPFTIDQVLSASFPSELTAAPSGGKVAWVSASKGVRNIMVAAPPAYQGRKVTAYTEDDGQELLDLHWTPDAAALVYVRGGSANGSGEIPNPSLNPAGASEDVWTVALDGAAPRKIGEGNSPAVSPKGDRVVFVRRGHLWIAPLDGKSAATQLLKTRGECQRTGVVARRHANRIYQRARRPQLHRGVRHRRRTRCAMWTPARMTIANPNGRPTGAASHSSACQSSGVRAPREAHRTGEPWSIRIASAETGAGRELWRAAKGPGSVFRGVTARNQLLWADGDRLIFPWEADGWTHLYSQSPPREETPRCLRRGHSRWKMWRSRRAGAKSSSLPIRAISTGATLEGGGRAADAGRPSPPGRASSACPAAERFQ